MSVKGSNQEEWDLMFIVQKKSGNVIKEGEKYLYNF